MNNHCSPDSPPIINEKSCTAKERSNKFIPNEQMAVNKCLNPGGDVFHTDLSASSNL